MRRIGILTYHRAINEGAILQTCSVLRSLVERFPEDNVEIIDYRSRRMERMAFRLAGRSMREIWGKIRNVQQARRFEHDELVVSDRHLVTHSRDKAVEFVAGRYDVLVAGSDVIWEIHDESDGPPFPNVYWLDPSLNATKVAFAVSANRTRLDRLTQHQWKLIGQFASSFALIGVRDDITMQLLQRVGLHEAPQVMRVPDPTFAMQVPRIDLNEKVATLGRNMDRPLVGIAVGQRKLRETLVKSWKEQGFQVACILSYDRRADLNLYGCLSPFEWANVFRYLDLCITDRMHPTIFSLKNLTPVLCLDLAKCYTHTESKTGSLLREMDMMESHLDFNAIDQDLGRANAAARKAMEAWDRGQVERKVQAMADRVNAFLGRVSECVEGRSRAEHPSAVPNGPRDD